MEATASAKYLARVGAEGAAGRGYDSRQRRQPGAGDSAVFEEARRDTDREVHAFGDCERERSGREGQRLDRPG
jgi:hypothetical protein